MTFELIYDERFERQYGFFRLYVKQVIYRYLDCGVLKNGFARIRCEDCGHEYLLAHSCKRRQAFRQNWARLIQKIYEVVPLICPKCSGAMRVIAYIEDPDVIKKILKHLGLWDMKPKPRPTANAPPIDVFPVYDEQPGPSTDDYIIDPEYPAESYF